MRDIVRNQHGDGVQYSEEIVDEICEQIAEGKDLTEVCKTKGMPDRRNVARWMKVHPELKGRIEVARQMQADALFGEMRKLARLAIDEPEKANAVRVAADILKWQAGRLRPKAYGDKVTSEITGADGGPVEVGITITDEDRVRAVMALLTKARANGRARSFTQTEIDHEAENGVLAAATVSLLRKYPDPSRDLIEAMRVPEPAEDEAVAPSPPPPAPKPPRTAAEAMAEAERELEIRSKPLPPGLHDGKPRLW